jgi:secondary thiamine-phosphate synthase enzyme
MWVPKTALGSTNNTADRSESGSLRCNPCGTGEEDWARKDALERVAIRRKVSVKDGTQSRHDDAQKSGAGRGLRVPRFHVAAGLDLMLEQAQHQLAISTHGRGFTDLTGMVGDWLAAIGAADGLLTIFIAHTSASLTIQENADPDVLRDLRDALDTLAPHSRSYRHNAEGADDMPAHIASMLTATSLGVPVVGGRAVLGTWQAIYLIEHRERGRTRKVVLHYIGSRNASSRAVHGSN